MCRSSVPGPRVPLVAAWRPVKDAETSQIRASLASNNDSRAVDDVLASIRADLWLGSRRRLIVIATYGATHAEKSDGDCCGPGAGVTDDMRASTFLGGRQGQNQGNDSFAHRRNSNRE